MVETAATGVSITVAGGSDTASYTVAATLKSGKWKAVLKPTAASSASYTITAKCTGCKNATADVLTDVVFGDVWYCGGQSNMALPLSHTLSRNVSRDAIMKGKYSNIRIHGMAGNMNPAQAWATLKDALADRPTDDGDALLRGKPPCQPHCDSDTSKLMGFSSTCYYFGESLSDELAKAGPPPPIGLVHTAWGGSTIEQWLTNETISTCANASISAANQEWHDSRVMPYVDMTVKGWVWYQGENDMHNLFGNSAQKSGYACLMEALVKQWRGLWSVTAGTTEAEAPFGLVTLAPSGTEGGSDIGTMRWAQTASYGMAPNPALPNTFVAQAYDLNDPYHNDSCYGKYHCHDNSRPEDDNLTSWGSCTSYCESVRTTNWYMVRVHICQYQCVGYT